MGYIHFKQCGESIWLDSTYDNAKGMDVRCPKPGCGAINKITMNDGSLDKQE